MGNEEKKQIEALREVADHIGNHVEFVNVFMQVIRTGIKLGYSTEKTGQTLEGLEKAANKLTELKNQVEAGIQQHEGEA